MGINYSKLVPVLIKNLLEQQKQIDELKALVKKLVEKTSPDVSGQTP